MSSERVSTHSSVPPQGSKSTQIPSLRPTQTKLQPTQMQTKLPHVLRQLWRTCRLLACQPAFTWRVPVCSQNLHVRQCSIRRGFITSSETLHGGPLSTWRFTDHFSPVSQDSCLLPSNDGTRTLEHTKALLADTLEMEQFCPLDDLGLSGRFHRKKTGAPREFHLFPNRHSDCSVIPSVDALPLLPARCHRFSLGYKPTPWYYDMLKLTGASPGTWEV